ncbi:hypothetical protein K491DRAFT_754206 [Lophiostoma macrostomum CBS 122681]|uniref:Uncharacterized protein n=1 Tax=Lophiostoma macrostomum CBS 122681 TaxID=1314788 RepID=A0A6A6TP48_9PLEO|nr:hypothetical protein K491DRAFT_754206 [Lophiostoma macrostomum CBS 122681]
METAARLGQQDGMQRPDADPGANAKEEDRSPLPYDFFDKIIELGFHPLCSLLLPVLAVAAICIPVHTSFFLVTSEVERTLVSAAHHYNVDHATQLEEPTQYTIDSKTMNLLFGEAFGVLVPATFALFWGWVSLWLPREKLLRVPPMPFLSEVCVWLIVNCVASFGVFFYILRHENGSARGRGCYTYIDKKGRQIAKCSLESAACYTSRWPEHVSRFNADQICYEAQPNAVHCVSASKAHSAAPQFA